MGYPPYFVLTTSDIIDDYGIIFRAKGSNIYDRRQSCQLKFSLRVASVRYVGIAFFERVVGA